MIFDKENLFSNDQLLTATAASTDLIDLGVSRDIGVGMPIELWVSVTTALVSAGATTLVVELQTDTAVGFGTAVALITTAAIPKATLVAGYEIIRLKMPMGVLRYLRLNYTVATGPFTGGAVRAGLLFDRQAQAFYASGLRTTGF